MTDNQIEAEARRLLASAMREIGEDRMADNFERGQHPIIITSDGALRAIIAALSPQPASDLWARLVKAHGSSDGTYLQIGRTDFEAIAGVMVQPASENDAGLIERLNAPYARLTDPHPTIAELEAILASEAGAVEILPNGEVRAKLTFINPDGPEAATRIATSEAENARLREALKKIAGTRRVKLDGSEPTRNIEIARAALGGDGKS